MKVEFMTDSALGVVKTFDILAYGDPNVDLVFEAGRVPSADEKVLGRRLGTFPGGTVGNFACAASRLGAAVAAFGRVGNDSDATMLLEGYRQFDVSTAFVRAVDEPSAAAMIVINSAGEKALVYAPMSAAPVDEAALSKALGMSRLVYAMPYDLAEFRRLSILARGAGAQVALDIEGSVAPNIERLNALLECSDVVFMNESGFRATSDAEITVEALRSMLDKGPKTVVVTMGASGALACDRQSSASHAAFPTRMVDATGAGDCFNGAFLAARFMDLPLERCVAFACAAASIAVSAIGARTALPTRADVEKLLNGMPNHQG
jgi:sugar/nucleoside kinase (ribokinase family)